MSRPKKIDRPIRVGISTCLLGQKVRFDGGHKHDRYITDILGEYFRFVPVCPELEVGMGVPRESVRLVGVADNPQMIGHKSGDDWTVRMNNYSRKRVKQRDSTSLCGFILKKDSPSCGMERVKVWSEKGQAEKRGVGLFARALMDSHAHLPVEEEGRLHDARLRENFIVRVFAFDRLRQLFAKGWNRGKMVAFHSAQKYLIMAHSVEHYRLLGQLVANVKDVTPTQFRDQYFALYMEALGKKTTTRKNVNVLQHIFGFLKEKVKPEEKRDILAVIEDYRKGLIPLIVPVTLLRHHVKTHNVQYILDQVYLSPHPKELMLRNHV
jgi:uncharacterized protein YbgA (DUF1722 family)/uncharacterized protein YbbK (DUF523 family)